MSKKSRSVKPPPQSVISRLVIKNPPPTAHRISRLPLYK
jgi:hypothetical protein